MKHKTIQSQYDFLKRQFKDVVLFLELGDFYETFGEDANLVAAVCAVVVRPLPGGGYIAGFPRASAKDYLSKLLAAGYKVAMAEQSVMSSDKP